MSDSQPQPFVFYTERRLVVLTGRKATNLPELLEHLQQVSGSSIFYHTHYLHYLHNFEKPRFYNEFADWASEALQEERLAEQLAAIDLLTMTSLREVREALVSVIEKHLAANKSRSPRECPPGDEFHFCEAKSFVMPLGLVANDVPEFFQEIAQVPTASLHYHFFEARLRLGRATNDFSQWLKDRNEAALAMAVGNLDPYAMTLDELHDEILNLGRRHLQG